MLNFSHFQQFLLRAAEDDLGIGADISEYPLMIGKKDSVIDAAQYTTVEQLLFPQGLSFRDLLTFRDVLYNSHQPFQTAVFIRRMPSRRPYPADLAVGSDDSAFETPILFRRNGLFELLIHMIAVIRVNMFD